jgi:hypothetical protein
LGIAFIAYRVGGQALRAFDMGRKFLWMGMRLLRSLRERLDGAPAGRTLMSLKTCRAG